MLDGIFWFLVLIIIGTIIYMPFSLIKGIQQTIQDRKDYQVFLKAIQPGTKWKCCGSMLPVDPFDDKYSDSIVTIIDVKNQEYYNQLWIKYKYDISGKVSTMLAEHFEKEFKQVNS